MGVVSGSCAEWRTEWGGFQDGSGGQFGADKRRVLVRHSSMMAKIWQGPCLWEKLEMKTNAVMQTDLLLTMV